MGFRGNVEQYKKYTRVLREGGGQNKTYFVKALLENSVYSCAPSVPPTMVMFGKSGA